MLHGSPFTSAITLLAGLLLGASCGAPQRVAPPQVASTSAVLQTPKPVNGWLNWRGPGQDGTYHGPELPGDLTLGGPEHAWSHPLGGGGTPVIADGRVFAMGTRGQGEALVEVLAALDARTGELLWERSFPDFLSDIIYERYAIGSPVVDPATGHVYALTSTGLLVAFTRDGAPLWEVSLMESYGRLTFPNGRTGSPVVVGDRVITRGITAAWGAQGPGRDRFLAFDVATGALIWASAPGTRPIDSSYSTPVVMPWGQHTALVAGTGCGHVVAMDAADGKMLWRKRISRGGVNASPLVSATTISVPHGKERITSSRVGGFITFAIPDPATTPVGTTLPPATDAEQAAQGSFTSSPTGSPGGALQVLPTGAIHHLSLWAPQHADPERPRSFSVWSAKLGSENLHASPLSGLADRGTSRAFAPLLDGTVHVIVLDTINSERGTRVTHFDLGAACLGAPSAWHGRLYIQTRAAIHAFGELRGDVAGRASTWASVELAQPRVMPAEAHLRLGDSLDLRLEGSAEAVTITDAGGLDLEIDGATLTASRDGKPGASEVVLDVGGEPASLRIRVSPGPQYAEDFEAMTPGARPPGWWLGAGPKWVLSALEGNNVLEKTLRILLFQRVTTLFGHPDDRGYSLSARVRSSGNRRGMGSVGLVNQRYLVVLDGNRRELVVSSNYDRFVRRTPFRWKPDTWYTLETRVDVAGDGSGIIRAKAWPSDGPEPAGWTVEAKHDRAHTHGAAGIYGFSPQAQHKVYLDDILMAPSEALAKEGAP